MSKARDAFLRAIAKENAMNRTYLENCPGEFILGTSTPRYCDTRIVGRELCLMCEELNRGCIYAFFAGMAQEQAHDFEQAIDLATLQNKADRALWDSGWPADHQPFGE